MGRIRDESKLPVELTITFAWPSELTREQYEEIREVPAAWETFVTTLKRTIEDDLSVIVDSLISEERYTIDVNEITPG